MGSGNLVRFRLSLNSHWLAIIIMKIVIVLLLAACAFSQKNWSPFLPSELRCPNRCLCEGPIPNICTYCMRPWKTVESNCERCKQGYLETEDGLCYPKCPLRCKCNRNFIINQCLYCTNDIFMVMDNCQQKYRDRDRANFKVGRKPKMWSCSLIKFEYGLKMQRGRYSIAIL